MAVLRSRIVRGTCPKCGARNQSFLADGMEERDLECKCFQCGAVTYWTRDGQPRPPAAFHPHASGSSRQHRKAPIERTTAVPADVMTIAEGGCISPREDAVLQLVVWGREDDEIGAALGITGNTVRFHLKSLRKKLEARTRAHLVTRSRYFGLTP